MVQAQAVRAVVFDVFGTLVDWRTSIARAVAATLGARAGDPFAFADAWRARYQPAMEAVRSGALRRRMRSVTASTVGFIAAGTRSGRVVTTNSIIP